jgi:glycosyltransferase involved in cell wall biosynthesis
MNVLISRINNAVKEEGCSKVVRDICLICPVYNEASSIIEFLDSVFLMSVLPEEMIIVDGGSVDGTTTMIEQFIRNNNPPSRIRVIVDPSCNLKIHHAPIAKARNVAIRATGCRIIACTDAGCTVTKNWLDSITKPLRGEPAACAVGGWYEPDARSFFERLVADSLVVRTALVNADTFLPSSRSIAFLKEVWDKVGGYPELSYTAEDTVFVMKVREHGCRIVFARDAVVYWRMKSNPKQLVVMVYRYGHGDGLNHILKENLLRNILKIGLLVLCLSLGVISYWPFLVGAAMLLAILPFLRSPANSLKAENISRFPLPGLTKVLCDLTYVVGYVSGLIRSVQATSKFRFLRVT